MTDIASQSIAQPVFVVGGPGSAPGASAPAGSGTDPLTVTPTGTEYEAVAASQTKQPLGATGAVGDYLSGLIITPATTSPGVVTLYDGTAGAAIPIFVGGASSLSNLVPFIVPLGVKSIGAGGWLVTTGANVSVVGVGDFA
jgi:hypothetical protein